MSAGTLHDLDNQEFLERFPLDMEAVTKMAMTPKRPMRRYHLEFDCGGAPFIWSGTAEHETEAIALGRLAIELDGRYEATARVAICLDRGAA